jgi:glycosyltransferase involved in cell wall biosynthesis
MLLAVVDTNFPFLLSGFRYWENFAFHKIDDSILFFSVNKMSDPFPAEVHPLHSITKYPITDIYCLFLNHTLGLLDCPLKIPGKQNYGLSGFIGKRNISIHTTIYAGGGYEDVTHLDQAMKGLKFLRDHPNVKSVFTNLSDVEKAIPEKSYRVAGLVDTRFFGYIPRARSDNLQLLFVANPPRTRAQKGLDFLIKAFNSLDPRKYHLHIVGDWKRELRGIKHENYTYHGTLTQYGLKEVLYKCHVIVNPAYKVSIPIHSRVISNFGKYIPIRTRYIPRQEIYASVDTFPLASSAEAMSTGCCLISTNHRHDHFALEPWKDYIEIREKSSEDIAKAIEYLYQNQDLMLSMARRGHEKTLKFLDAKKIVAFKYGIIKGQSEEFQNSRAKNSSM